MNLASGLIGVHTHDHAKINEWIAWCQTTLLHPHHEVVSQLWGLHTTNMDKYNQCVTKIKDQVRVLDKWLNGKKWISGDGFSVADIFLGTVMIPLF